jgi:enterochelin esterase-like enzyme
MSGRGVGGRAAWALALGAALATAATAGAGPGPGTGAVRGTVLRETMSAPEVGDASRTVRVYLPPSYAAPDSATRAYPVVFLLHGWPGSDGNWFEMGHVPDTADSLIARGAIPEVILVCPNGIGGGFFGRSFWIDSYDGRKRVESYVVHGLVGWVDAHYRTRREPAARSLIGLSDGADAAFNLALRHPDVFGAAAGHSGDYVLSKSFGCGSIYGPDPGGAKLLDDNSPARYIEHVAEVARRLRLYLDCGTDDESLDDTRAFHQQLVALGVPHEYREFPGSHTWKYWGAHVRESLMFVTAGMH